MKIQRWRWVVPRISSLGPQIKDGGENSKIGAQLQYPIRLLIAHNSVTIWIMSDHMNCNWCKSAVVDMYKYTALCCVLTWSAWWWCVLLLLLLIVARRAVVADGCAMWACCYCYNVAVCLRCWCFVPCSCCLRAAHQVVLGWWLDVAMMRCII